MSFLLIFAPENGKSRTYPIAGECLSVGRHPKNTVFLDHESVSIFHAEVRHQNGRVLLRDLKSSNGTKVNRQRISEVALQEGDEIRFGPIICHLRRENIADARRPDAKPTDDNKASARAPAAPAKTAEENKTAGEKKAVTDKGGTAQKTPVAASTAAEAKSPEAKAAQKSPSNTTVPPPAEPAEQGPPLPFHKRMLRRISESRFFMLSLLVHSVIVILAGSIVLFNAGLEPPDFVASGGDGLLASTDDLSAPPETPVEKVPVMKTVPAAPSANAPTVDFVKTSASNSAFKLPMPQVQMKLAVNTDSLTSAIGSSRSFAAALPGTLGGRVGAGRARAMAQNGMKPKSEQAVLRGLTWLALHQNEDGSWGDEAKGAMTGFGLLCFLGHGELQDSPLYGETIGKALTWISENGNKHGGRLHMADAFSAQGVYEHAICAYALGEYYTMTKDRRVVDLLKKAVGYIIEGQGPNGGWMYTYDKSADDLSVSGWQIQALKAAHLGALGLPAVDQSLNKAAAYLTRVRGTNGGYGYRGATDDYSLTGVGLLCQLFWKSERSDLRKGMTWMLDETEKHHPVKYRGSSADLYAWYYHTQACLMFGGDAWKKWNEWFQDEICDAQNADGGWPAPGGGAIGPQSGDTPTGAVYRTSLCVLMLEVFYRYMPTTRS